MKSIANKMARSDIENKMAQKDQVEEALNIIISKMGVPHYNVYKEGEDGKVTLEINKQLYIVTIHPTKYVF